MDYADDEERMTPEEKFIAAAREQIDRLLRSGFRLTSPWTTMDNRLWSDCNHSWKLYQGFTDSFEYCEHCDKRRD